MSRRWTVGIIALVTSFGFLPGAQVATASASSLVPAAMPGPNHWVGTWGGEVSSTPAPPPGDPQNPYKIVISIDSVTRHKVGTARYPAWKCNYTLTRVSVSGEKLKVAMTVINPGPFPCASQGTAVMRATAKGATWRAPFTSGFVETGSLKKAS